MAGRRRSEQALRGELRSPGRPPVARAEHRRRFWALIAAVLSSEDAAMEVGVSQPVGTRWFREAGGMAPSHLSRSSKPLSGRYLTFAEREEIALWRAQGLGVREVARRLGRAPSTISRGRTQCVRPAQPGDAKRQPGLSGDQRPKARRTGGASSEAGEAGHEPGAADVCARPAGRCRRRSGRGRGARAGGALEGSTARAAAEPAMGYGVEPAADRQALAARLPGRQDDAHQP